MGGFLLCVGLDGTACRAFDTRTPLPAKPSNSDSNAGAAGSMGDGGQGGVSPGSEQTAGAINADGGLSDQVGSASGGDGGADQSDPDIDGSGSGGGSDGGAGQSDPDIGGAGGTTEETSWTPLSLNGLALWLDAAKINAASGSRVAEWSDSSPFKNHARQNVQEHRPIYSADAANGHPAIQFDGQSAHLQVHDSESLKFGIDDFGIDIVASWTNTTINNETQYGHGLLLCKHVSPWPFTGVCVLANYPQSVGDSTSVFAAQLAVNMNIVTRYDGLNDGVLRLLSVRRVTADQLTLRVNGGVAAVRQIASDFVATAAGAPLTIGGEGNPLQALRGRIAEIVLVRGEAATVNESQLESYFNRRYGLW